MQKIDIENWKAVPGYEGKYQVSDLGNVRSLNYNRTGEVKVLKIRFNRRYLFVSLCINGEEKNFYVHKLVWISFNGEIPKGMQINHINENKFDNRLSNLEVVTPKQNLNHGTRNERAGKSISKALKGKMHSAETKAKMCASQKARRQREHCGNKIS